VSSRGRELHGLERAERRRSAAHLVALLVFIFVAGVASCSAADSVAGLSESAPSLLVAPDSALPYVRTNDIVWGVNGHPLTGWPYMRPEALEDQFDYLDSLQVSHYRIDLFVDTLDNDVRPGDVSLEELLDIADRHHISILPVFNERPDVTERPGTQGIEVNYRAGYKIGNTFAAKYGKRVTHIEAGNELDYVSLLDRTDGTDLSKYDSTRLALTTAFLRGMTRGIRDGAPDVRIIIDAGGWYHYAFFSALQRDSVDYDIIGVHWYSGAGDIDSPVNGGMSVLDHLDAFRKDIWITEADRMHGSFSEAPSDSQSLWIAKYVHDYHELEQIKGFFVYELYDDANLDDAGEAHYGLIECSAQPKNCIGAKTPKPAFDAYRYGIEEMLHGYDDYVSWLFAHVVRRAPDSTELNRWTRRFISLGRENRWSKPTFVESFVREHGAAFVRDEYERLLGRDPDGNELAYWSGRIAQGGSQRDLITSLCDSSEFWALGGGTDEGFIDRLYRTLLRREPDPDGSARYMAYLTTGWSRGDVIASILDGSEYQGLLIDEQFQELYGRLPDPDTRAYFIEKLQNGMTYEQLLGEILCRDDLWEIAIRDGYRRRFVNDAARASLQ
jgi:hypothetical protein